MNSNLNDDLMDDGFHNRKEMSIKRKYEDRVNLIASQIIAAILEKDKAI